MSGGGEAIGIAIAKIAVPALLGLIEKAVDGDDEARKRLVEILGPHSASEVERMLDEAVIDRKFPAGSTR